MWHTTGPLQANPKRQTAAALKSMYYRTAAAWTYYNDTAMLAEADILFQAPEHVVQEFPQFPAVHCFAELKPEFVKVSHRGTSL